MSTAANPALVRTPRWVFALFIAALVTQLFGAAARGPARRSAEDLPAAPPVKVLRALALGDPEFLSGALVLYLQSFDDQPGVSIPFRDLNYPRLAAWLDRALALDPHSDYPLLLAAQVYSQVPDPRRQRIMLDFVHSAFAADPNWRWRWLAHASIVARHRLRDDTLALSYARDIATHAPAAPGWARQMQIFLLEDLGEREQAKVLLGGLLATGAVTDPAEIRFLTGRLEALTTRHPGTEAAK
ncbi:MAG TPA: hypothetical protein VNT02_15000 [Burkholderiales bacterium]|nr:hypothetical protein [Burkholderiales bacterium]